MHIYTLIHVLISLIAIIAGIMVTIGLLKNKSCKKTTLIFLMMTAATDLTGFGFIRHHVMPAHVVGVISLLVLALTIAALYTFKLNGPWRKIYVAGALASLYLNVFVLIVQSFLKIPYLHTLAPTQAELPFKVTQGWMLVLFLLIGSLALKRFQAVAKRGK